MRPCFVVQHTPPALNIAVLRVTFQTAPINADPDAKESFCIYCLRDLPIAEFFWSRKKSRWTFTCRECERTGDNKKKKEDGKDFYRPVEILQRALHHNRKTLYGLIHDLSTGDPHVQLEGDNIKTEELRHLCERFILLDERCRLISEKIDEVEFLQAAVEAQKAENNV